MDDMETQVATKVATKTKIAIIALMIASIAAAGFIGFNAYRDISPSVSSDDTVAETYKHHCVSGGGGTYDGCEDLGEGMCQANTECKWVPVQD